MTEEHVTTHLNEFNTNFNQLFSVQINFNNEACTLVLLASLLKSWRSMPAMVSNSVASTKLNFNDVSNRIFGEEVRFW